MERIAKGVKVKDANVAKYGDSWIVRVPIEWVNDLGIKEPTPCSIFRNLRDHLIIEVGNSEPETIKKA